MRSLSMPDNLVELGKDIEVMQDHISSSQTDKKTCTRMRHVVSVNGNVDTADGNCEDDNDFFIPLDSDDDVFGNNGSATNVDSEPVPGLAANPTQDINRSDECDNRQPGRSCNGRENWNDKSMKVDNKKMANAIECLEQVFAVVGIASQTTAALTTKNVAETLIPASPTCVPPSPTCVSEIKEEQSDGMDKMTDFRRLENNFHSSSSLPGLSSSTSLDDLSVRKPIGHDRTSSMLSPRRCMSVQPSKPSLKRLSSLSTSKGCSTSSTGRLMRSVSFHKLEIREYNVALSDHPSCSYGPPVQLGWDYRDKKSVPVEDYEETREPRRTMDQMVLSYDVRRYLLLKRAGYSKAELNQAMREVDRVQRERLVTELFLPASKIDETVENISVRIKDIFLQRK